MPVKKHSVEQIMAKLREVEKRWSMVWWIMFFIGADKPPRIEHLPSNREHPDSDSRSLGKHWGRACSPQPRMHGCLLHLCFQLQIGARHGKIIGEFWPS